MLKKVLLYLSNIRKMVYINKMRFILCFIGVFVSVGLYSVGLITAESFKKDKLYAIEEADDFSVSIKVENIGNGELDKIFEEQPTIDITNNRYKYIGNRKLSNGRTLDIKACCHGITDMSLITPFYLDNKEYLTCSTKMVAGRFINEADDFEKNSVVVIDEITSLLLFDSIDSIGKKISFREGSFGAVSSEKRDIVKYSVVGVIQSTYEQKKQYVKLLSAINNKKDELPQYVGNIYVPIFAISEQEILQPEERMIYYTYSADGNGIQDIQKTFFSALSEGSSRISYVNSKELSMKRILSEISNMRSLINLGMIILGVLCSINITSIVLFSIKERIPEMAIRRALGATKFEIIFQVFLEMIIVSFTASFIAVVASYLGMWCYSRLALKVYGIWFLVRIDVYKLLLPIFIGMLISAAGSLIPAVYASKTSITKALKFE